MTKILGVASPKGGAAKTTEAIHMAKIAANIWQLDTLLADADDNRSALDWVAGGDDDTMPFAIAEAAGSEARHLARLRRGRSRQLTVVDLPGDREGAFQTMLQGEEARPVADLLLIPVKPRLLDLRPVYRVMRNEVLPLDIPYLIVITPVMTKQLQFAAERQQEIRDMGFNVANTIIRAYDVYADCAEIGRTVLDMPGTRSKARDAETDQLALADELLPLLGFTKPPARKRHAS